VVARCTKTHTELLLVLRMRLRRTSSFVAHTSPTADLLRWSLFALAVSLCACGGESEEHSPAAASGDKTVKIAAPSVATLGEAGAPVGTCASGDARECKVMLASHGDVANCFVGIQICENDAWGPCQSPAKL
jgi:hypothetical protein